MMLGCCRLAASSISRSKRLRVLREGHALAQELDGDVPAGLGVNGLVHHALCAAMNLVEQLVACDGVHQAAFLGVVDEILDEAGAVAGLLEHAADGPGEAEVLLALLEEGLARGAVVQVLAQGPGLVRRQGVAGERLELFVIQAFGHDASREPTNRQERASEASPPPGRRRLLRRVATSWPGGTCRSRAFATARAAWP